VVRWGRKCAKEGVGLVRCDRAVKVGKVAMRHGEVRSGEAAKDRSGMIGYGVITHERSLYESNHG
jgi:hypothetical protein